ncbi:hypothetical protein MLD52_04695 [Puniceicoccaceae bacterium K14]|nr:hypothetical protein [Puniceicoccaceae bacterium K14]
MEVTDVFNSQTGLWEAGEGKELQSFSAIGGVANPTTSTEERVEQEALGQAEFFKLLTTQLANQDPLEPMDDTQFIAQMANFSALEMQSDLNTNFSEFTEDQEFLGAQSMIGKQVDLLHEGQFISGIAEGVRRSGDQIEVIVDGSAYTVDTISSVGSSVVSSTENSSSSSNDGEDSSTENNSESSESGSSTPEPTADKSSDVIQSVRQIANAVSDGGPTLDSFTATRSSSVSNGGPSLDALASTRSNYSTVSSGGPSF